MAYAGRGGGGGGGRRHGAGRQWDEDGRIGGGNYGDRDQRRGNYRDQGHGRRDHQGGGHDPGMGRGRRDRYGDNPPRMMGFMRLKDLLTKEPSEILMTVSNERTGFMMLLNKEPLTGDFVSLIISASTKATSCLSSPETLMGFLNGLRRSSLLTRTIPSYITNMTVERSVERQRKYREPLKDLMVLLKELLNRMPSSFEQVVPIIATMEFVIRTLRTTTAIVDEELDVALTELISLRDDVMSRKVGEIPVSRDLPDDLDERRNPPNDFRTIEVFPTLDDIHLNERPFLRANKTEGRYDNLGHYLDVQFRLLREDFVAPLRDGISEFLLSEAHGHTKKLQDIRLYHDVHVLNPVCTPTGIAYRICFDIARLKYVRWEATKRLIFGSLVCLSKDDFKTMLFATVSDRSPQNLKQGEVSIQFEHNNLAVSAITPDESYVMAETSAYFEAYRHVLKGLKDITDDNTFPFYKYIVRCDRDVAPPKYLLRSNTKYDLRCLLEEKNPYADSTGYSTKVDYAKSVSVFEERKWPDAESLKLDRSQFEALKAALTREFTVIQGPPGTGKTFLGLKVVSALLENKALWCKNRLEAPQHSPILIVCYTNHALDQFLEGIHGFCPNGIVRVGGRSVSKILEQYYLRKLRQNIRERREVSRAVFEGRIEASRQMDILKVSIERTVAMIEASERGLLHEEVLQEHMSDQHYLALKDQFVPITFEEFQTKKRRPSVLTEWLGLGDFLYMEEGGGMDVNEVPEQEEEEEGIEIQEEAEALAQQRMLDADDDDFAAQRRREDAAREQQNRQAAEDTLALNFDELGETQLPAQQDRDGAWQQQRHQKKRKRDKLRRGLRSTDIMTKEEVDRVRNMWAIQVPQRWRLYRYWLTQYRRKMKEGIQKFEEQYHQAAEKLKEVRNQEDMAIMKEATVVGMTTTAAARYRLTLQEIKPKIIVIEEAAEVLEAHIVTTLSAGCEHLILIGDHKQLRPSPNVYKLAEKYKLKISLFERMVNNGVPCEMLEKQHRMRPQISSILKHIYSELQDHESVKSYEDVKGVSKNMFFINHGQKEDMIIDMKSRYNEHEARFVSAFCKYLLLQGYKAQQITVLTMYTGQLIKLKKYMPRNIFEGVRVTAVDNFQGEENDIILLSLVRSNMEDSIGFLRENNRVCVALSRAKIGFYVIGNLDLLAHNSDLWSRVVATLRDMGCTGKALQLYCQNHPDSAKITVACAADFERTPEGGCLLPCDARLPCGHVCERVCHTYDMDHKEYKCKKPCNKMLCNKKHQCKKRCYQPCGECTVRVQKRIPSCGHVQEIPCHMPAAKFPCLMPCDFELECGHKCQNMCGSTHSYKCMIKKTEKWPCGHEVSVECHKTPEDTVCPHKCRTPLDCNHPCVGTCGTCSMKRLHVSCKSMCNRTLVCGHACLDWCTKDCPPCTRRCENRCVHSRCPKKCGEPCVPCKERCSWQCEHFKCTRLCHEPCNRPRCDQPCRKRLNCGHPCIGLCGEKCPTKCRICDQAEVEDIFFGTEVADDDEPPARFVQLEDCGHVLEVTSMDQWMETDTGGAADNVAIQLKGCPKCKTAIRKNLRYGPKINAVLTDIEKVKDLVRGQRDLVNEERRKVRNELKLLEVSDYIAANDLEDKLNNDYLTMEDVGAVANATNFLKHLSKVKDKARKCEKDYTIPIQRGRMTDVICQIEVVRTWVLQNARRFSDQQLNEGRQEITRIELLCRIRFLQSKAESQDVTLKVDTKHKMYECILFLTDGQPLTEEREKQIRKKLKVVQEEVPMTGLGISDKERLQILDALKNDLSKGHWFKCPKGHIYGIGDCGGAQQSGTCPECGAIIGGQSYRLNTGNQLATEMDSATQAAWPTMT